jgi:hypothetical protein
MAVIAALAFAFSFGNVWQLGRRRSERAACSVRDAHRLPPTSHVPPTATTTTAASALRPAASLVDAAAAEREGGEDDDHEIEDHRGVTFAPWFTRSFDRTEENIRFTCHMRPIWAVKVAR